MSDDRLSIVEDTEFLEQAGAEAPWLLLIIDDDDSVHRATRFALGDFKFEDRGLRILSAYSASEARDIMKDESSIAVVLLDVVMESEYVGLELVHWIRDEMHNDRVRIVLRTGQPGYAPELDVIRQYDINDYKDKSGMTAVKLVTTIYSALRSFRDIDRLEHQSEALRNALKIAETASRAKTDFITHMSHEFRTPLNGIIGMSEMIASEALGPVGTAKYKEYAWDIVTSGRHLQSLVESVLEFAEDGDGKPLTFEVFDLQELIAEFFEGEARGKEGGTASKRRHKVRGAKGKLMVRTDRKMVQTMMTNLVSNAFTHNPDDCSVRVTARRLDNDGLLISVVDDGVGIDKSIITALGQPFNFARNPYTSGHGGLGLGLLATKRLITRLGGDISIESEPNVGTTVRLIFPEETMLPVTATGTANE